MTVRNLSVLELTELCARHAIGYVGLWREPVARTGLRESARLVREAGLRVSSLCRGGFFTRLDAHDENRRAVEEAVELGTDLLVLVCGGMAGNSLDEARNIVADGIAELAPFANTHGIRLGVEPLHPMYAASRSVINTLAQALAFATAPNVGVVIDVYHVWWDPHVYEQIQRARGRIFGFHICDWLDPMPDFLNGRGMMGDGVCEIRRLRQAVDATGYTGPIEVEIFNEKLWAMPPDEVVSLAKARCRDCV